MLKRTERSPEPKSSLRKLWFFVPAVVWAFFIFYFSVMPGDELPRLMQSANDKLMHAFIYFLSAGLIYLGFVRYNFKNPISRGSLLVTIMACILFGAAIEIVQEYVVEKRAGDWMDFLANTTGAVSCVLLLAVFQKM